MAKQFAMPLGPFGTLCSPASSARMLNKWEQVRSMAFATGWPA